MAKNAFYLVFAAAALASVQCAAAIDVLLKPDGSVMFGERKVMPLMFSGNWNLAAQKGGYEIKTPGKARFRLDSQGKKLADAEVSVTPVEGGALRLEYLFTMARDAETLSVGCGTILPEKKFTGRTWRADGKSGTFEHPPAGVICISNGKCKTFSFETSPGAATIVFATTNQTDYLVQDGRKWSDTYSVRLGTLAKRSHSVGEALRFSFTVSSDEGFSLRNTRPYVIEAGREWVPLDYRRDIEAGSALDFSGMGFADAPAGKFGWLVRFAPICSAPVFPALTKASACFCARAVSPTRREVSGVLRTDRGLSSMPMTREACITSMLDKSSL